MDFHVTWSKYRTCAVQTFHDVQTRNSEPPAAAAAPVAAAAAKRSALDCSEYVFPDVLALATAPAAPAAPTHPAGSSRDATGDGSSHVLAVPTPAGASAADLNFLTKNQQFRLRKIQYSDQRISRAINPNNCVLWDHQTGYVFFTGIWRLYQDVMHALVSLERPQASGHMNTVDRKAHCQQELDYAISKALYERALHSDSPDHFSRKAAVPKRTYRHSVSAASGVSASVTADATTASAAASATGGAEPAAPPLALHYSDIHWYALDPDLKESLCRKYQDTYHVNHNFEFHDLLKRIRGGYIKIQGTWLPFEVTRALCLRFCYPIRYLLVPIFGPTFPSECAEWYSRYVALYPPRPKSRNQSFPETKSVPQPAPAAANRQLKRSLHNSSATNVPSPPPKKSKVDVELLDASQNLLELSRQLNGRPDRLPLAAFPPMQVPQYRRRASSWTPEIAYQHSSSPHAQQALPPIRSLLDSLERSYPTSPPNSAGLSLENLSSPLSIQYTSPPLSPKFGPLVQRNRLTNQDPNFVAVSSAHSYVPEPRAAFGPSIKPPLNPLRFDNVAHFYNSNGHKYSYPGGMQVIYHPQNPAQAMNQLTQQPSKPRKPRAQF